MASPLVRTSDVILKEEGKPRSRRKVYFAITLAAIIAVSSTATYLRSQLFGSNKGYIIKGQMKDFLQMTIEAKSTVVVGEPARINITIKNLGNESFYYSRSSPLGSDNKLSIAKIGEMKKYYVLHYRWIDLFNGIGCAAVVESRTIRSMEEITEVFYAKFLEVGEYNVTASFPAFSYPVTPPSISCSITLNVVKADDVKISLDQAINISSFEDLEFASLIRSESLSHPIWFLRSSGYPYYQVIVDAVYGNSTPVPNSLWLSWCILEMLEYQSPDKHMYVIIGAKEEFTPAMVEQLEELGAKNVTIIPYQVFTRDDATALIPCNYEKIMKIAQLWFVCNLEGLMSVS